MHPLNIPFLIGGLGGWEIFLILLIALLLFGAKRLPELARGVGQSIREFKKAASGVQDEIESSAKDSDKPTPPAN